MDESLILALSIAEAVQADEAILEQYRLEDQVARDFMLAQALSENRQTAIEPLNNQPLLEEETLRTLRLLNITPLDESGNGDEGNGEAQDPVPESAEDEQVTQQAGGTDETQDAHEAENTPDNTEDTDNTPEVETLRQQPEEPATSHEATVEQEEVVAQVDDEQQTTQYQGETVDQVQDVDQQAQQHQEESQEPSDLVAPTEPELTASIVNTKSTSPTPASEMKQCIVCGDDHPDTDTLETLCSHNWCQGCLVDYVEKSMEDESLFPPKCCNQTIPIEASGFISQEVLERFQEKTVEFGTGDRIYCSDAACATFISPQSIEAGAGIARCSRCEKQTCASCKKEWHEGVCPNDKETQAVVRLGKQQGWRKCDKCNHLIQRSTGCNHMTCRCKHEFCYRCGAKWRTCRCALFELAELLDQPAQAAANNGQIPPAWLERARAALPQQPVAPRRVPVVEPAPVAAKVNPRELDHDRDERQRQNRRRRRAHPDCRHRRWNRIEGEHRCNECAYLMTGFILRCEGCQWSCCHDCKNRVPRR